MVFMLFDFVSCVVWLLFRLFLCCILCVPILYLRALFIGLCKFHVNQFYASLFFCVLFVHCRFMLIFLLLLHLGFFDGLVPAVMQFLQQWNFERKSNMRKRNYQKVYFYLEINKSGGNEILCVLRIHLNFVNLVFWRI